MAELCDWCNKDAVYSWNDKGETRYACSDHKYKAARR